MQNAVSNSCKILFTFTMGKLSKIGPGTEGGRFLLQDFKNWRATGFKPWGPNVGSAAHYQTRQVYQIVSQSAFRSQAKKIARIALEQMPACDVEGAENTSDNNEKSNDDDEKSNDDDEKSLPNDSEKKNPWLRFNDLEEDDDDDDDDYDQTNQTGDEDDSHNLEDNFVAFQEYELQNSRSPLVLKYPCGTKLLLVFALDGDVNDQTSNQFEFVHNNKGIKRWSRIPKEREKAEALVGNRKDHPANDFGYSDIDLFIVDKEVKQRMKAIESKRDNDGYLWEVRDIVSLPFLCVPFLFSKTGKRLKSFQLRTNGRGFYWAFFWLQAAKQDRSTPMQRIGGKFITETELLQFLQR